MAHASETVAAVSRLDDLDKRLLNQIQQDFPLVAAPFAELGRRLGTDEADVMARLETLKRGHIVRQISAIFDTRRLGYKSSLVAAAYDPERVHEAAKIVNAHPGVSHNYERDHTFNLWYTIAVPPYQDLAAVVQRLHELSGARSTRMLPTLRLFKIAVKLDMTGTQDPAAAESEGAGKSHIPALERPLTAFEIACLRELQQDIEIVPRPFAAMAARIGTTEAAVLEQARQFQADEVMRRFAAVLYHRKAGFGANGMSVWRVPEDRIAEYAAVMVRFNHVSHCYQRPVYPDWPYNLFAMTHGRSRADCQKIVDAISAQTGLTDYTVLFSTREYKKVRVLFYTADYDEWVARHMPEALSGAAPSVPQPAD